MSFMVFKSIFISSLFKCWVVDMVLFLISK
uniref:Macaca fascicularis brain cDNA, clone: QtrA-18876 n=1 Tax=Macaca fascicularis TaxID=9541 RepID=I7GJI8_MACFA|nr:unnamed protein product [Macaca fascicularis]